MSPIGFGPSTHGKNYVVIINNYMIKKKKIIFVDKKKLAKKD